MITSEVCIGKYTGDGVATEFAIPFKYRLNNDLTAQILVMTYDGTDIKYLVQGTDYTVEQYDYEEVEDQDDNSPSGGNLLGKLVFETAPAVGLKIAVLRNIPLVQRTDWVNGENIDMEAMEGEFDQLVMCLQQLQERSTRTTTLSIFSDTDPQTIVEMIENYSVAAQTAANQAITKANEASSSASDASSAANVAESMATLASTSANASSSSATSASEDAALAKQYAIGEPTEPTGYSAKYWAEQAAASIEGMSNATISIKQNGVEVDSFTLNQAGDEIIDIATPTKVSDLDNDSGFINGIDSAAVTTALGYTPVNPGNLADVATTGDYDDLDNKPTIPVVNNSQITFTQGGVSKGSFTLNQANGAIIQLDAGGGGGGGGDGATWGNVGGNIADQIDLMEALDAKQDLLTSENAGNQIEIVEGGSGEDVTVSGNGSVFLEKAQADSLNSVTVSGGLKRSLLPDGYTQYDYITTNSNCYFITDYYPNNKTEIRTKTFMNKQPDAPMVTRWQGSPTNDTFGFYMGNVENRLTFYYGNYSDNRYLHLNDVAINMEHDIYMGVSSIILDGVSYSITRDTFTSTQPMYIGAFNQTGSSIASTLSGRIYPAEFIEDGKTIRHYIPCKNDSGVIGLYEAITGNFISSSGTGIAKKGRPYIGLDTIPSDYERLSFLQSSGTQYIDTGITANFAQNKVEQTATVQYTTSSSTRELMGTNGYGFWGKSASDKIEAALGSVTVNDSALNKNNISWTTDPDGRKLILNVNTNQYTSTASSFVDADYVYYVFALGIRVGSGATASFLCNAKVYDYLIAVDDEVVSYLIPVRRISDSILGMYDIVSGTFKTNAGTGSFTAGSIQATPSPSNPIPIVSNNGELKVSKNLVKAVYAGGMSSSKVYQLGTTPLSGSYTTTSGWKGICVIVPVVAGKTYVRSGNVTNAGYRYTTFYANASGVGNIANALSTVTTTSFTAPSGANYAVVAWITETSGTTVTFSDIQVELGSTATEYSPYGEVYAEGITETITDSADNTATAEMLLSMDDYTDTQEILSGAVTRKVGITVFTGFESWVASPTENNYYLAIADALVPASNMALISTHYNGTTLGASVAPNNTIKLGVNSLIPDTGLVYVKHEGFADVDEFKNYLQLQYANGTPVIVVYPLATPTTETVTGQTLTTVDGDNTLNIQASIENLPIQADYTQKGGTLINWVGTNYYTKSEVQALIAAIPNFSVQVLQQLPQTGEELVLYFIPKNGTAPDVYDEYIWIEDDSSFELIGSTQVDLTGYATETYVDTGLSGKQATLVSGTNIKTINSQSLLGSGNISVSSTITYDPTTETLTWS